MKKQFLYPILSFYLLAFSFVPNSVFAKNINLIQSNTIHLSEQQNENLSKQLIQYLTKNPKLLDNLMNQSIDRYIKRQQVSAQKKILEKQKLENKNARNILTTIKANDHIKGSIDAKFLLVEYSDFQCPFCKRFHATAEEFYQKHTNEVAWILRYFPLQFHEPLASKQAIGAECISIVKGENAFWQASGLIFKTNPINENQMIALAEKLSVDRNKFISCFSDNQQIQKISKRISNDIAEGKKAGVRGTPGIFLINQETKKIKVIPGAVSLSYLEKTLSQLR